MEVLTIVIIMALLATVLALVFGLISLAQGGSFDKDFGTGFMWARVGLQGLAISLLVLALFLR